MVSELKIEPLEGGGIAHKVIVDGQRIRCSNVALFMNAGSIPEAEIEVIPHDLDILAKCETKFFLHPRSIKECMQGIRFELMIDDAFRDGFIASIESALDEAEATDSRRMIAERILERIIGAEDDI